MCSTSAQCSPCGVHHAERSMIAVREWEGLAVPLGGSLEAGRAVPLADAIGERVGARGHLVPVIDESAPKQPPVASLPEPTSAHRLLPIGSASVAMAFVTSRTIYSTQRATATRWRRAAVRAW